MNYYIVSESDLVDLCTADFDEIDKAYDSCFARPVRFLGAHGEGSSLMLWGEEKV